MANVGSAEFETKARCAVIGTIATLPVNSSAGCVSIRCREREDARHQVRRAYGLVVQRQHEVRRASAGAFRSLEAPHGTMNPGGFDFEAWMLERHCGRPGMCAMGARPISAARANRCVVAAYAIERARSALRDRCCRTLKTSVMAACCSRWCSGPRAISDATGHCLPHGIAICQYFACTSRCLRAWRTVDRALWRVPLLACALGRANRGGDRGLIAALHTRCSPDGECRRSGRCDVGDGRRGVDFRYRIGRRLARTGCSTRMPV